MRVMLRIAYDGTNYSGWQIQPDAVTVEGIVRDSLKKIFKADIITAGASRTDAGVHSYGNLAVFDADTHMPAEKISFALNSYLPDDIRIISSCEVEPGFHPRNMKCRKTYEYKIWNDRVENPVMRLYSHFCHVKLDVDAMKKACTYFIGEHDFSSFCASGSQVRDRIRTIYDLHVERENSLITVRVTGNGFLYNMVRIIIGTLIRVGEGKTAPSEIPGIIEAADRRYAGPTAPAKGLALVEIQRIQ